MDPIFFGFLEYIELEKKYSKHTVLAYKNDLTAFQDFCKTQDQWIELTTVVYAQIRSWIVFLVDSGISNRTVNRKVSSLNSFFKFLVKTEQSAVNPLANHKALKVGKYIQVPFSESEMNEVLEREIDDSDFVQLRDALVVMVLYATGMRRAELMDLTLDGVDLSNSTFKVLGKRNKERYVPMLKTVKKRLFTYLKLREEQAFDSAFLFVTNRGNKMYGTLVYRIINQYFSRVSTKVKRSPHVIRHSFATHLLNEGADLNSVKELLGHSSLASTQVYTHTSLDHLKQVYNQAHPRSKK
jgi:integrase/recombinase XerC